MDNRDLYFIIRRKIADIQTLLKNSDKDSILGKQLISEFADILSKENNIITKKHNKSTFSNDVKTKVKSLLGRLDSFKKTVLKQISCSPVIRTPTVTLARLSHKEVQMNLEKQNGRDNAVMYSSDDDDDLDDIFEPINVKRGATRNFNGFNTANLPEKRIRKQIIRPDFVSTVKKVKLERGELPSTKTYRKVVKMEREDCSSSNEGDSTPSWHAGNSVEFPCPVCKKIFRKKGHMTRHLLTHEPEKPFGCDFCPKRFAAKYSLQMHLLNRHNTDAKPFECDYCDKRFTLKKELDQHMASHKEGFKSKSHPCHLCELKFITKEDLDSHLETHPEANIYHCGHCDKTFPRRYNLSRHERTHSTEKPFHCDVCNKDFGTKNGLHLHLQSHELDDNKHLSCHLCNKRFCVEQNLELHISYHNQSDEKPFSCELCEVRFKSQERLDRHFETHGSSEGRVYPCQYCEKTFPRKYNLVRHELSHTHGRRKPKDGMPSRLIRDKGIEDADRSDEENIATNGDENSMLSQDSESTQGGNRSYVAFNELCKSDLFAVLFGIGGDAFDDYDGPSPFSTEQFNVVKFENY